MNKKLIRLTESDLHRIVKESVQRILSESSDDFLTNDDGSKYSLSMDNVRDSMGFYPNDEDYRNKLDGKLDVRKKTYGTDGRYDNRLDKIVTLDDLSPKELQYLLDRYKGQYGGTPGYNGVLMSWAKFWQEALNDYANKKTKRPQVQP